MIPLLLAATAVGIMALSLRLIFRSEASEAAAYARHLTRRQSKLEMRELRRRHRAASDGGYWIIPGACFFIFWTTWTLLH